MSKITIAIPAYEYHGFGYECLHYSFEKMTNQTFKDFDVVVSDHSTDDMVKRACLNWSNRLNIKYIRNENKRGNPSANTNNAIRNSTGEWIKILCQDDYLYSPTSLAETVEHLEKTKAVWAASGYVHTYNRINFFNYHIPKLNPYIAFINTIGTPSCVTVRNMTDLPYMDEQLLYAYDCEWYYQLILQYGTPLLFENKTIVNYLWSQGITASVTTELLEKENRYIIEKHFKND